MISAELIDGGTRRQITARCDRGSSVGCKSIDQSMVQSKTAGRDFIPVEEDAAIRGYFTALGWLQHGDKDYCSKFCSDKHKYDLSRAQAQSPVEQLADKSFKPPPPRGTDPGGKKAPTAPRVSR